MDRGVLVISELALLSSTDATVSLIRSMDATLFIGTTARNGAADLPLTVCDTRILRFRVAGGTVGFFIMPYDVFNFCGESFVELVKSLANDLRRVKVPVVLDCKRNGATFGRIKFELRLCFGDGERMPDVDDGWHWKERLLITGLNGFVCAADSNSRGGGFASIADGPCSERRRMTFAASGLTGGAGGFTGLLWRSFSFFGVVRVIAPNELRRCSVGRGTGVDIGVD